MKITDALLGEHATFYALFDAIELLTSTSDAVVQIQAACVVLESLITSHAGVEERLLFPAMETQIGKLGPLAVMRQEHNDIEQALEAIEEATDMGLATERVRNAVEIARNHFRKEEVVLFRIAQSVLSDETLTRLGSEWASTRGVSLA